MAQTSRSADLTSGPMLQKIILFSIPLAASSILQLLFNAADVVVVGRFAGSTALAAVGSNGSLINLLVNLFVGLSLGANVVAARCFGAKDERGVQDTVQTSVTLGLVSGVLLAVVGFFAARGLLELMSCPEDVIDLSALYLKIYFIGMPMTMLYNFSSALLRAVGDTKRPLYCLAAAGLINVVLNLVFVIGFSMSVAGVALATIISQTVSACMVTRMLMKEEGALHLDLHHLGFHMGALKQILLIGLPAGLQSTVFSLSNVVIQSAINSFGSTVVAGSSASANLEGFVYTAMNAFSQAAVTFTSQNMGARKYQNLNRVVLNCLLCAIVTGVVLGGGAVLAGTQLLHFYNDLLHLDFGTSRRIQNGASVVKVIGKKFGVSMRLGLISAGISLLVGIMLGILQTAFKDKVFDWIGTAYTVFVNAVPSLVSYSLVLVFGSKYLGFPTLYSTRNVGPSSVLPIVCLSLASIAGYALWTRRYMVDELTRDYIKLARVKGLSSSEIMFKHVLRNAMVPMVQYIPQSILLTVGGSLLMERFFSVPGMGPLLTDAIQRYDLNVVQTLVILYAALGIVGVFLGDVLMMLVDPRITLTGKEEAR